LQKEANGRHGFLANKTLSIAQKLHEAKLVTYPCTGSRYIFIDVFDEIPELITVLKQHPCFGVYAGMMDNAVLNIRRVNNEKIINHHVLLIMENAPNSLSGDEQTVYEMVAGRMLKAFSKKCVKDATVIILNCVETLFEVKKLNVK
jgi:DNA topoisomerase-3